MAEKIKFQVNRSMQGDKEYNRGDTRSMTEAEAAPLLASGALSRPGEEPAVREPAVKHTFGTAPAKDAGYVSATGETVEPSVTVTRTPSATKDALKTAKK